MNDPVMDGCTRRLKFINAYAERSPGFVWRLQTDDGDATAIAIFGDPELLVNMSVWENLEALANYVYKSAHRQPPKERQSWFLPIEEAHLALWWVPAGHQPSVAETKESLIELRTASAFTFEDSFPAPGQSGTGRSFPS